MMVCHLELAHQKTSREVPILPILDTRAIDGTGRDGTVVRTRW